MGIVQNLEIKRRKSDNKPIAFFDLEDKTGIVHVCCFTKAYEKFQEALAEDLIVKLIGRVNVETDEQSGETLIQLYMENINPIQPDLEEIIVFIRDMTDWNQKLEETRKAGYIEKEGHPLVIYDLLNGEFRKTRNYVNENILSDKRFETRM